MTTQEFKDKYPHLSHLEGNELWNAMEDAMLYEQKDQPTKPVVDWMGNELKEGDEFCFIKVRAVGPFKNFGIMIPDGKGVFISQSIPDGVEEDCWYVGEYSKIEKGEMGLFYTSTFQGFTFHQHISLLHFCGSNESILAIKGVSDNQELYKNRKQ